MKILSACGNMIHKAACLAVYGYKYNGHLYLRHLRNKGMRIGEGTIIFNAKTTTIDESDPQMIVIGKNVQITGGGVILSHDYGWSVLKAVYGEVMSSVRPVKIGDNVYIGMNAMILAGSTIGNNVIIGANSVVTGNIPDNCIAVGCPCRKIYPLNVYYERRKKVQLDEAVAIARQYFACYGKMPPVEIFSENFWLWENNKKNLTKHFVFQNNLIQGSEEMTWRNFENHIPLFKGFQDFLSYVFGKENNI